MANSSGSLTLLQLQSLKQEMTVDINTKSSVIIVTYTVFVYINSIMLAALRTKAAFCDSSRYLFFAHMLFNDILHLGSSMLLFILTWVNVDVLQAVCCLVLLVSSATFTNEPLILAAMSLERYVAVCFPLRHGQLSTPQRTVYAMLLIWALGSINIVSDILAVISQEPSFLLKSGFCVREQLVRSSWQRLKALVLNILFFSLVGLVLLFTYMAIMIESKTVATDVASARKAMQTVLLHAFQLSLSILAFFYNIIETLAATLPLATYVQLRFVNYIVVLVVPRCLSSLIYGLRDKQFRPVFMHYFTCRNRRVKPES